jgi:hypothetical protein
MIKLQALPDVPKTIKEKDDLLRELEAWTV